MTWMVTGIEATKTDRMHKTIVEGEVEEVMMVEDGRWRGWKR